MCVPQNVQASAVAWKGQKKVKPSGAGVQGISEPSSVQVLGPNSHLLQGPCALLNAVPLWPLACLISEHVPLTFMLSELVSKQKTSCLYYSMMSQLCL